MVFQPGAFLKQRQEEKVFLVDKFFHPAFKYGSDGAVYLLDIMMGAAKQLSGIANASTNGTASSLISQQS